MSSNSLVSIIIVNWNGGKIFRDCLISLKKINYPNWELIVVDNDSSDGSEKIPRDWFKKLTLIKNKRNIGFALANNLGFEKTRGEFILLLNNDTKIPPDLLDKLVRRLGQEKELGIVQPKIVLMDNPGYLDNCGSYLTSIGFLEHWGFFKKDGPEFNREKYVFSTKGACMLIRKEIIEEIGLFDEDFGSYFEESDFCWRVWLAGWKVIYYPGVSIKHKLAFSAKRRNPFLITYDSYKNRICSILKNLELKNMLKILSAHFLVLEVLTIYFLLKLQFRRAWIIQKAIYWNLVKIKETIKKRTRIAKFRKLPDREVLQYILKPLNPKVFLDSLVRLESDFKERKNYLN